MTRLNLGRRDLLKTTGAAGVGMVAGCQAPTRRRDGAAPPNVDTDRIAADPTDVPPPVTWSEPRTHEITLTVEELTAEVAPGVTFDFMTFEGQVPGPMLRVRRGDRVRLTLTSAADNDLPHNIDFHAVYGPGGGAEDTTIGPGESATIEFTAMYPGAHIYHCAVPNLDQHISSGMFGTILVEPEGGLPEVDRELYFGQHEVYAAGELGEEGHHAFDFEAMEREEPTYVVFNGESYAFTEGHRGPIPVNRGEQVRIYWANGGPNLTSSWHAIGNVWSKLYRNGDLVSEPARFVETTSVAPGSVSVATIDTPVPGPIKLVDHAITRADIRGALGVLQVQGEEQPDIYEVIEKGAGNDRGKETETFDGWLSDVSNYSGIVDKTGVPDPRVAVGAQGNRGNFAYEPAAIKISKGTTLTWEWTGEGGYHDVAEDGGAFSSDMYQEAGTTFTHTFDETGVYKYYCTPHKPLGMKGVVVVE